MAYGTQPHDWRIHELESMENCLSLSHRPCVSPLFSTFHNPSSPTGMNAKQACCIKRNAVLTL